MPSGGPVLVTGAEGFVGRHLLAALGNDAVPTEADVLDVDALRAAVRAIGPRAAVHLAARSWVAESWREAAQVWHVNAIGTVNVVEALRAEQPDARLLMVSTGEVYGRARRTPTPEDEPVAPLSPYAASKAAAELACSQAAATGVDVVVARAFQHEGPGRDERFAIGSWTRQIAQLEEQGGGTLLVGDLSAQRDITDVRDVCRAYRLLLNPAVPAGIYNVASGKAVAMQDVLELLLGKARCPISVEIDRARLRPVEIPVVAGEASRLLAATGWVPTITLEQTLEDALEHERARVRERIETHE